MICFEGGDGRSASVLFFVSCPHTYITSSPPLPPDNVDLGTACGKLHRVSVLAITDAGDSDILKTTEGVTA